MHAEFLVKSVLNMPGLGVVVSGEVTGGQIEDGAQGKTSTGKIFTLIRLDIHGEMMHEAKISDKANLTIKNVTINDVKPGETLLFF